VYLGAIASDSRNRKLGHEVTTRLLTIPTSYTLDILVYVGRPSGSDHASASALSPQRHFLGVEETNVVQKENC